MAKQILKPGTIVRTKKDIGCVYSTDLGSIIEDDGFTCTVAYTYPKVNLIVYRSEIIKAKPTVAAAIRGITRRR